MRILSATSLLLVLALLALSSYLRLDESGLGCDPWPQCYGRLAVNAPSDVQQPIRDTYERLAIEAQLPLSWATPWHRLVASVLGLLILAMTGLAFTRRRDRVITVSLLGLTAFLAWLGIYSEGLLSPAVVMGNLGGGFLMLGLLGWMVVRGSGGHFPAPQRMPVLPVLALCGLAVQILLGGFTSANFAATACAGLPTCQERLLPHPDVVAAFDISGVRQLDSHGFVVIPATQRAGIHQLHRLSAVVVLVLITMTGANAIRRNHRMAAVGATLIALVLAEFAVGLAAVITDLPISLAVAHNWLAAIVLLLLLKLLADARASDSKRNT